jgi:hypothetical protein
MTRSLAIAKDAYDRPLKRLIIARTKGLTYLANSVLEDAVENGESWPIGFPSEYVYAFDEAVFSEMECCLREGRKVPKELWLKLTPYRPMLTR